jgi:hypothetical protein
MIPSLPIDDPYQAYSWRLARRDQARIHSFNSPAAEPVITPRNLQCPHLQQLARPHCATKTSRPFPRLHLAGPAPVLKSP